LIVSLNFPLIDPQKLTFKPCINLWQWFSTGSRWSIYRQRVL